MNKVYKVIWNAATGSWTAVSELGKSKTKTKSVTLAVAGALAIAAGAANAANVEEGGATVASGDNSVAIGTGSSTAQGNSIAIGSGATTQLHSAIAVGLGANSHSYGDIAIGVGATADTNDESGTLDRITERQASIAIGSYTVANKINSVAIGNYANATTSGTTALGNNATADGQASTAIGEGTDATGDGASAVGRNAQATDQASTALGDHSQATGYRSTATGPAAVASGRESLASGSAAVASGFETTAVGAKSLATKVGAVATGALSQATAIHTVAVGNNAIASAQGAVATGAGTQASGVNSIAAGYKSNVSGEGSGAFGYNNTVTAKDAFVLGSNVVDPHDNSVVLGANSTAVGYTPSGDTVITPTNGGKGHTYAETAYAGVPTADKDGNYVSIGAAGSERQIKFLAAGNVSSTSTDAINGSQLFAVMQRVEDVANAGFQLGNNDTAGTNEANATRIGLDDKINFNNGSLTVARVEIAKGEQDDAKVHYDVVTQALKTDAADGKAAVGEAPATANGQPVGTAANPDALTTAQNVADAINASGFVVQANGTGNDLVNPGDKVNFANGTATTAEAETVGDTTTVKYNVNTDGTTTKVAGDKVVVATGSIAPADATTGVVAPADKTNGTIATVDDVVNAVNSAGFALKGNGTQADVITAGDSLNFVNGKGTTAEVKANGEVTFNVDVDSTTVKLGEDGKLQAVTAPVAQTGSPANGDQISTTETPDALATAGDVVNAVNSARETVTSNDKSVEVVKSANTLGGTNYDLAVNVDGTTIKKDPTTGVLSANLPKLVDGANTKVTATVGENGETVYSIDTNKDVTDITSISITGPKGADGANGEPGKDGDTAVITVAEGPKGVDGKDGADGAEGKTRIVYTQVDPQGQPVVDANGNPVTEQVATLNDGLKFVGNDGNEIIKKLNETVTIRGGADLANPDPTARPVMTEGNIGVVNENGELVVKLAKDVDLGANGSLNAGTITIPGVDAQGNPVEGVTTSLTSKAGVPVATDGKTPAGQAVDALSVNGNQITDVANGQINATSTDAINGAQLYTVADTLTKAIDEAKKAGVNDVTNTDSNLQVSVTETPEGKTVNVNLAPVVTVGEKDAQGNPVGNPVTIDGKEGTIGGLTNKTFDPANIVSGQAATEDQLKQVAEAAAAGNTAINTTIAKGLNFAGNQGDVINKQLGEQVDVIGGLANDAAASSKNVRVDSEAGKLVVKISENPEFTTVTATDKIAIANGPSMSTDGIDAAGKKITNVAAGTADTDAVNVSQLKAFEAAALEKIDAATKPTISADKDANAVNANATDNGTVKDGTNGTDGTNGQNGTNGDIKFVAGDNITVTVEGEKVTIGVDKNPQFETVTAGGKATDGTDGKDGKVTVADKAGNPGVTIAAQNGEGTIGLNGKDGANATISVEKGADNGKFGVDGTNGVGSTTEPKDRLVYVTAAGSKEQVATLNDGIKFTDDKGATINTKLNEGITIKGNAKGDLTDGNIGVVAENGALVVKLAKDVDLGKDGSVTAGTVTVASNNGPAIGLTSSTGPSYDAAGQADGGTVNVLNVGTATNPTRLTGVANGEISATSKDAINGSQLYNVANSFNNNLNAVAGNLNGRINDVEDNANAGTAGALATAGLPQVYLPGKNLIAVAAGTYEGKTGYAVGFSSISDGGNWILKGTASGNSESKFGGTIGLGYQW